MSLATRCAACGTVFRVVQDQLKVSEGWVRCGRCGDVFNALEGLFDLEREPAPAWTPSQRGALELLPASADEHRAQTGAAAAVAAADSQVEVSHESIQNSEVDTRADSQIETRLLERDDFDEDDGRVGRREGSELDEESTAEPSHESVPASAWPEPAPAFVRQADRAALWQRPRVQLALAAAGVVLALLLVAQAAIWQRDVIAARWPATAPLLGALCEPLACRLEPLRRLEGLAVESSGLTQLGAPSLYQLRFSLRNRDTLPLHTPALDLTLTDNRGEVVVRRVLGGRDFGSEMPTQLAAGAELALQAVIDTGERRISGYSIEIFYP
jgi:predicted Zn finger-like uncharacterized protein